MKRLNCLCLVGLLFVSAASAARGESIEWVRQLGTSTNDYSSAVSADGLGNVYISGSTEGSLGGPNAGPRDAFVSKYDAAGNLQWSRQLGTGTDDGSLGVSADGLANVYISGYTLGSLGGPNAGDYDTFVSKYDAAGNFQWSRQLGTIAIDASSGVSADGLGNVYISGYTYGSLGGPIAGGADAFVSKYDAAGNFQWTRQLGTSMEDQSLGVSADGLGNVYISGQTGSSLGGPSAGAIDAFVSKYDAAGNFQWTQQLGTSGSDTGYGVSADGLGNIYLSGYTSGNLGGPNAGFTDAFVSKYDAAGNFQWTQQLGTSSGDLSLGVSADGLGNVYFSGYTRGSLGGPNAGVYDAFVVKIADPAVPEPSTLLLLCVGSLAVLWRRRRFVFATILAVVVGAMYADSAIADTFGSGANTFDIEFVSIGNPGNAADTTGSPNPAGSVPYTYRMGKFEISEQMIDKANALGGLGITKDIRGIDKPATDVTWNEVARFVNWLNTSAGSAPAYKFAIQPGAVGYDANASIELWTISDAGYDPNNLYRNSLARYFLPSVHEWYKAAYYDPTGGVYYDYPTGSDTAPTAVASGTAPGTAVYNESLATVPADITLTGGLSPYGTMGQGGNVREWQETDTDLINGLTPSSSARVHRGGHWLSASSNLGPSIWSSLLPSVDISDIGFRVASNIPEPSTLLLLSFGSLAVLWRRRGLVCASILAAAVGITCTAQAVTIDTVTVGNAGNAGEVQSQGTFGAVGYNYRVGKTEVTNAQYVEFLNGVDPAGANPLALYDGSMSSDANGGINFNGGAANGSKYAIKSGRDNNPVVFVSWYDSIRFANWLHNGQGSGDTESGAYTLLGGTQTPSNGNSITRNAGAKWWLPSEDEWYKAAYHKNDGVTGNYWDYATSTDAVPYSDEPPGSDAPDQSNTANFVGSDLTANGYNDGYAVTGSTSFVSSQNYLTDVGTYILALSPYGTFDQGGNVWEWNEALISSSFRGLRGGPWNVNSSALLASNRVNNNPTLEIPNLGFRVASSIPEPSTLLLLCFGSLAMLWRRRGLVCAATLAVVIGISGADSTIADSFGSGANTFDIEFVSIGNPGNVADTTGDPNPAGSVPYTYRMGKFEISEQMIDKANALGGLGITKDTRGADKPATSVMWNEAARFVNWLNTSTGSLPAYNFTLQPGEAGYSPAASNRLWTPSDAGYDPNNLYRNTLARYFLPSVDEWYKAAYYDPSSGVYYDYPTGSDTAPTAVASGTAVGTAVYDGQAGHADITLAGGLSAYGTMGQGGNVFEWGETDSDLVNGPTLTSSARVYRGGEAAALSIGLSSAFRGSLSPNNQSNGIGFRVASNIPEPNTLLLLCFGSLAVLWRRRASR